MGFLSSPFRNAGVFGHKAWQIEIIVEAVLTACRTGHSVIFDLDGQDDFEERYSAIGKLYWKQSSIRKAKQKALRQALQLLFGMVNQEGQSLKQRDKGPNSSEPSKVQEFDLYVSMGFSCTIVPCSCVPVFTCQFGQDFDTGDVATGRKGSDNMEKK